MIKFLKVILANFLPTAGTKPQHISLMSQLHLKLYIARFSPPSRRAVANLRRICKAHFGETYDIEIIDVVQEPQRAELANITVTPTLVKEYPPPLKRLIGDLSQTDLVISELTLEPELPCSS